MVAEMVSSPVTGIWDDNELFTKYRVDLTFTGRVMGGIPQKPEMIEGWLKQRVMGGDEELRVMMIRTLEDLDIQLPDNPSREQIAEAAKRVAAEQHGNTFRRDEHGLFLSDYQIKAALKENTNILFAGERWGTTKKGPKSYLSERVFVDEERIYLGRQEPDGTHLQIGHVTGPQGPRSTLTYYDFVEGASVTFTVSSMNDCIKPDQWKLIFLSMQRNGLGALRSMGYGQFKVTGFQKA